MCIRIESSIIIGVAPETTLNNLNRIRSYRMFSNEHRKVEMNGFIDGDFVEMFIDMTVEEQKSIVKDIDVS